MTKISPPKISPPSVSQHSNCADTACLDIYVIHRKFLCSSSHRYAGTLYNKKNPLFLYIATYQLPKCPSNCEIHRFLRCSRNCNPSHSEKGSLSNRQPKVIMILLLRSIHLLTYIGDVKRVTPYVSPSMMKCLSLRNVLTKFVY